MENLILTNQNLFTATDHAIVRSLIKGLPGILSVVVELRYWRRMSLMEIAFDLGIPTSAAENALAKAEKILRERCLRHPGFSRSRHQMIQKIRAEYSAA